MSRPFKKLLVQVHIEDYVETISKTLLLKCELKYGYRYDELNQKYIYDFLIQKGNILIVNEEGERVHKCRLDEADPVKKMKIEETIYNRIKLKLEAAFND